MHVFLTAKIVCQHFKALGFILTEKIQDGVQDGCAEAQLLPSVVTLCVFNQFYVAIYQIACISCCKNRLSTFQSSRSYTY